MATWRKILVSGSAAELASIVTSGDVDVQGTLSIPGISDVSASVAAAIAGGDNMGNHTANQDINLNTFDILGVTHISASGNISSSATSTASFGRYEGSAQHLALGSGSIALNAFTSDTTLYTAINEIDKVLNKLAPAKPANLSTLALGFATNGLPRNIYPRAGGSNVSGILSSDSQNIRPGGSSNSAFFDGDSGTLTARVKVGSGGSFTDTGSFTLSTANDTGTDKALEITADEDPYAGTAGSENFWKQLKATINLARTASIEPITARLEHSGTGQATDITYHVADTNFSTTSNRAVEYNENINGFHYQSGIKYLGLGDTITGSYTVTIHPDSLFLNGNKYLSKIAASKFSSTIYTFTGSSWTAGQSFNVTSSISVNDNQIGDGGPIATNFAGYDAKSSVSTGANITRTYMIDSTFEDETNPSNGAQTCERSGSGTGEYPTFAFGNAPLATYGGAFDSSTLLTDANHHELRFVNKQFKWPVTTNYTSYTPAGPDYSGVATTDGVNNLRYAVFNLGTITAASSVDLIIQGAANFDAGVLQTTDNFVLQLQVMNGATEVTQWIDCNAPYEGVGDPTDADGDGGVVLGNSTAATSGNLTRRITFGDGGPVTGTVYARIGYSDSTRIFNYLYLG